MACPRVIAQSSMWDSNIQRFVRTSAIKKNTVFNVKKLLNDGMDLTIQQRGKMKQCEQTEKQVLRILAADGQSVTASKHVNTNLYQEFLRQHVVPWVQRTYLSEYMSFRGFSTGPHCQDYPAVVGRILESGGLDAIFAELEFEGLLFLVCCASESPGDASL
jgi:hypothetical protein